MAQWLSEPRLNWHLSRHGLPPFRPEILATLSQAFRGRLSVLAGNDAERRLHLTAVSNSELDQLKREIAERQRYIEGQQVLIDVLEHDGHDVREQDIALNSERSKLDQQLELLRKRQA